MFPWCPQKPELTLTGVVVHYHFPARTCSSLAQARMVCSQKKVVKNVQAQICSNDITWKPVNGTATQTNTSNMGRNIKTITDLMELRADGSDQALTNEFSHQRCLSSNTLNLWEEIRGKHSAFWPWPCSFTAKGLVSAAKRADNESLTKKRNETN